MDDFAVKIGEKIKEARIGNGFTQEELAEMTELSVNHISKLERGVCSVSLKNFCKICKALHLSLHEIVYQDLAASGTIVLDDGPGNVSVSNMDEMTMIESHLKQALAVIYAVRRNENCG
ncbi:MAG: helix-turn-helix transcriptional regulator [Firmicutes bacterium]|jgi:transcriptional regulator with XRE-family HTH domain|nr:helix-turn-helix transcriptional regulator [Bacillota bacterium]